LKRQVAAFCASDTFPFKSNNIEHLVERYFAAASRSATAKSIYAANFLPPNSFYEPVTAQ
jgi:hypothetical protein